MTPCIEGPTKPIKDADHKRPVTHWKLAPGRAWKATSDGWEACDVSVRDCKIAQYTFNLVWIRGVTAAVFTIDGVDYAQPTREIKSERLARERGRAVKLATRPSGGLTKLTPEKPQEVRRVDAPRRSRKPLALRPL